MSRKMTSALVFILAVLLTTVPAWSSTPGPINPAGFGNSLTVDLNTATDYTIKTEIILARGGGGGGNGHGGGGQGGHGNGHGGGGSGGHGNGVGDGSCDGEGPDGPGPGPAGPDGDGAGIGRD